MVKNLIHNMTVCYNVMDDIKEIMLSQEEWNELNTLKNAINQHPASVHPVKMERFTELFVKTLEGKGDLINREEPTNY
jgi:hypothetical protein